MHIIVAFYFVFTCWSSRASKRHASEIQRQIRMTSTDSLVRPGWSARECIGWLRIVRPGSVLGAQQRYLEKCQFALSNDLPWPDPGDTHRAEHLSKQVQHSVQQRCRHLSGQGLSACVAAVHGTASNTWQSLNSL